MKQEKTKTKPKEQREEILPINKIIQKCEQTLEITQLEQQELKKMFSIVSDKMHQVNQKILTFEREERLLRRENDEWEFYLKEKSQLLKQLTLLIDLISGKDHSFEIDISTNPAYKEIQHFQPKKKQYGEDLLKTIQNDETSIIKLQAQLQEIEEDTKLLRQSGAFWNCVRCNVTLKEGFNEETCIFHPGKLKYFSCRTCGGDEYFTCCNQCRDCNPGCKKGLHKP
ncbi:unnamed protein product (macronuclear) [Paramecium tetraurelia]|uniref:Uncharacterized protein n=1 Tax=Paramecium tetraurelia TaxID=5888 RepID=A0CZU6_PARTE|nr:uncharacterized protein GSPATT00011886001 [Paramecium tetraurelia]CAK76313.1 unnamed protein product [Paramecium tetraurelia]|eukprot:XP_001443710.1 hypothetical protein (macronuclear) [Paramecium tetraurelia strain d4-2]